MSLVYMDKEAALDEFEEELLPRMKDETELRDLYSAGDTKQYITDAVRWATFAGSRTAFEVFSYVAISPKKIRVVGMKGGFQCFGTAEGKAKEPVIFIDLDGVLNFKTRLSQSQHKLQFESLRSRGQTGKELVDYHYKNIAKNSAHTAPHKFEGRTTELSNRIATFHEIGHAKQWIENPNLFLRKGDKVASMTNLREDIRRAAREMAGKGATHILKKSQQSPLFEAWDPIVEMDNMSRHEWPICEELGLGYRKNYADLGGHTGGHGLQLDTLLRRKLEAREAEEEAKKPKVELVPGQCPYCPRKFNSNSFLRNHVMREHSDKPPID